MDALIKPRITFCVGYKYQSREDFLILTKIVIQENIYTPLVTLVKTGNPEWPSLLSIKCYFAWDGCSGPTNDDRYNAVPCLEHDAFGYLMRIGALDPKIYIGHVNKELFRTMVLYNDTLIGRKRAQMYHYALDHFPQTWATQPRVLYTYP